MHPALVQIFHCLRNHLHCRYGYHGCGAIRACWLEDYRLRRNSTDGYGGSESPTVTLGIEPCTDDFLVVASLLLSQPHGGCRFILEYSHSYLRVIKEQTTAWTWGAWCPEHVAYTTPYMIPTVKDLKRR